jgi:RimJ/RimL family protein N-acetyltransferase
VLDSYTPLELRAMAPADVPGVVDVQQPGAVIALSDVFPQDRYPFPRDVLAARWHAEIVDAATACYVIELGGALCGFAMTKGDEFSHFGIAVDLWGSGLAAQAHDQVLDRLRASGFDRVWLDVYEQNRRARRFYEKLEWQPTGHRSRGPTPPHAELLRYERSLRRGKHLVK